MDALNAANFIEAKKTLRPVVKLQHGINDGNGATAAAMQLSAGGICGSGRL
jgi:hypothetical protein